MLRKMSLFFLVLLLGTAGLVIPSDDVPKIKLSNGDPAAGQKVFADMKCYTCHYVAGEAGRQYQNPVSTAPAPLLDSKLAAQTPMEVATSIVAPSHTMSPVIAEEAGGKLSPMASFDGLLDEKQLSDLVAYLRSLEEPKR